MLSEGRVLRDVVLAFPRKLGEHGPHSVSNDAWCPRQAFRDTFLVRDRGGVTSTCHAAADGVAHSLQLSSAGQAGRAVLTSGWVSQLAYQISREKATD